MGLYILLPLAIIPPIIFMLFIIWMDRQEPESMKHIFIALMLGIASIVPALVIQLAFGFIPLFHLPGMTGGFFESFFLVAPSEEFFKFFLVYLFIRKKKFFDEINDGIVYFGAGAIGFALLENIMYVVQNGFGVGVMRAFTSIPLHTFCGVIIGYHYGLSRFTGQKNPRLVILRGILLAIFTHASYNTLLSSDSMWFILFIPLVIIIYAIGAILLRKGRKYSLDASKKKIENMLASEPVKPVFVPPQDNFAGILADETGRRYFMQKRELWKAVTGRIILGIVVLLWGTVIFSLLVDPSGMLDIILGTFMLTFVPVIIGLLLEISYRRGKNRKIYLDP